MANKSDFDKIDTNKDGVISEEEYANASKSAGVEKHKLNWFLRLITLGDRFDIKDFFDRFKKSILEFIILVFGVTVSFGIEQQGGESDNRNDGIENLNNLREEIDKNQSKSISTSSSSWYPSGSFVIIDPLLIFILWSLSISL